MAPTQALGEALRRDARSLEGFRTLSAKVPCNRNLIVFPAHLGSQSYVEYEWTDPSGLKSVYRVDQNNPDGTLTP